MKQPGLHIGPELFVSITRQAPGESPSRPRQRVLRVRFAVRAPGIRKEVVSRIRDVTSVGRSEPSIAAPGDERWSYDVHNAVTKTFLRYSEIARIFSPNRSKSCLHHVADGNARLGDPVPLAEARRIRAARRGQCRRRRRTILPADDWGQASARWPNAARGCRSRQACWLQTPVARREPYQSRFSTR